MILCQLCKTEDNKEVEIKDRDSFIQHLKEAHHLDLKQIKEKEAEANK